MKIYYNFQNKQWESDATEQLYFGKNNYIIRQRKNDGGSCFRMKLLNKKVGPLIGIFTSKENRKTFYGNRQRFITIQNFLQRGFGGIAFVFTQEGLINEDYIKGYIFDQVKWEEATFPLPDLIYNRVATYKGEEGKKFNSIKRLAMKHNIPFYNPHFFEKWHTFSQLQQIKTIQSYLPITEQLINKDQVVNFLHLFKTAIIKPVLSNRGEGIFLISENEVSYEIKTNDWSKSFHSIDDVWQLLQEGLKNKRAIIQRKITLKQYQQRPYDLRILVQRNLGNWFVTGIGVRLAGENKITTHVPKGGTIIPFEAVNSDLDIKKLEELATTIAHQLEISYGYLVEFSIDVGIDKDNHFWIFEVNSKPMKFDEPFIQEKAIKTLTSCFYQDTGFT